ncbi:mannose-1-phosphate guanylyltransferase/mannose-6-phosphate isomerase [Ralstonia mojiangensis]|uniref:mannose-1-phosphate guanylyltransferase/mannose-6-phosphate isomerase n=1 Tax=Ralstonia mojiangensis TaxID=2953895 RepID=UPI0037093B4A
MKSLILPVVLSGGAGTRLWPLSRKSLPKQFVPLVPSSDGVQTSLLTMTLARAKALCEDVMVVASDEHRFLVQESVDSAGVNAKTILEPMGRDTAAAIAVAALNAETDQVLLFMPADHHIPDIDAFARSMTKGVEAAKSGFIVTFGVVPYHPSTAYGYIQRGEALQGDSATVSRFIEKPPLADAQNMLMQGGFFWNAGIFMVRTSVMIDALGRFVPDVLAACRNAVAAQSTDRNFVCLGKEEFAACPRISIDYAVLERHERVAVVPFEGQWSDVGSWREVARMTEADENGNRFTGEVVGIGATNTFVHAPSRPVVVLGTDRLLVVDTKDALLVAHESHSEQVKQAVAQLERIGVAQAVQHRHVARPWGSYDSVDMGQRFQVKRITVKPGAALSLQMHHHRAEHWIVVCGTAKVTRGKETFLLTENQSTYIPLGEVHRLENPGKTPLEIIEVQSGSYLGEDDIVRFDDNYDRKTINLTGSENS